MTATTQSLPTTAAVLAEIAAERDRQDTKWGPQNHPNNTGSTFYAKRAVAARRNCQLAADAGMTAWDLVLLEEVYEALAESDPAKLRAELVQVAAVAAAWIEAIDRHNSAPEQPLGTEADPICGDRNDDEVCELAPHADGDHRNGDATVSWPAAPAA